MSGCANSGNVWQRRDSISTLREGEGENKDECTPSTVVELTEHDYIGLSNTSLFNSTHTRHVQANYSAGTEVATDICTNSEELEDRDTELRLGIGPVCNGDANLSAVAQAGLANKGMVLQPHTIANTHLGKQGDLGQDMPSGLHPDVFSKSPMEFHQSFWPWVVPGRFMIPVPKVSTVPAKRSYMEIIGEIGNSKASSGTNSSNTIFPSEAALPFVVGTQLPRMASSHQEFYTWSHGSISASYAQHVTSCADAAIRSPYASNVTPTSRALPPSSGFKLPPTLPASQYSPPPPTTPSSTEANIREETATVSKAPVVGWPPVRTFRKNNLLATAGMGSSKAGSTSSGLPKQEDNVCYTSESVGEPNKSSSKDAHFVKAKLDGVRICRKVDLTAYDSYDSLKSALQEMFEGFICSDNTKLDLVQGRNYVLTHEDKDGDWMLVGDVPWHMFVTTVKSFRIMKAADAVGLGGKVFAKLKAQGIA